MIPRKSRHGRVLVHTGEGKGKSSSAFGVAFRAAGWGFRVCVIQFIKGRWQTGERRAAKRFDNMDWYALGDGFTWETQDPDQDASTNRKIWEFAQGQIGSHDYDLVVLDEINYCTAYGWIQGAEVADFLRRKRPEWMHVILTGRDAAREVVDLADTVTEMRLVKHAYTQGIEAEQGIEF